MRSPQPPAPESVAEVVTIHLGGSSLAGVFAGYLVGLGLGSVRAAVEGLPLPTSP